MKRRTSPTARQIEAALALYRAAAPARTATEWIVHWPNGEPTLRRYQTPVTLARVLGEHHAAVAAHPIGD